MKIIFLTDEYPPDCEGGAGFSTHILAKALNKAGQEMLVISATRNKNLHLQEKLYEGVKVFYIFCSFNSKLRSLYSLYNPQTIPEIKKRLLQYKPDVVHAHNVSNLISFYSIHLSRRFTKSVFFTARDTMAFTYGKFWWYIDQENSNIPEKTNYKVSTFKLIKDAKKSYLPFRNIIIRYWLNNNCSKIFTVSAELKKAFEQNGFKNVHTLYNSVEVQEFDTIGADQIKLFKEKFNLQNKKIIFIAGRLSYYKGMVQALKMIAEIKTSEPNVVLGIASRMKFDIEGLRMIHELGIKDNIKEFGWLDRYENSTAYKAADICISPSIYLDPFPRVNLEALAAKKPVVGTCFGGTPEIIEDGKKGYIINPYDTKFFAAKVLYLLKNPFVAKEMGEFGYQIVRNKFNPAKQAELTLKYYQAKAF